MSVQVIEEIIEVVDDEQLVSVEPAPDQRITLSINPSSVTVITQDPGPQGPPGPSGPQGPPGPQGPSGDAYFTYQQIVAATTWGPIIHNLGKHPSVTIVDSGDNIVYGDVHYIDANSLTISFSVPFGGSVYCN